MRLALPPVLGSLHFPHPDSTQGAASHCQNPGMLCCHGEESLGEVARASSEAAPGACGGAASVSILISLTAYETKLHIWREIIPRENSQPDPSEAALDVNAG